MAASALQREIKKKKPFDSLEEEVGLNLLRTNSVLGGQFDQLFRQHGTSEAQYNALRILRGAGGDGLPCLEIASRMIARVPDITRLLDRLDAAGLVARRRIPEDRRVVLVAITQKGLDLLAGLDKPMAELIEEQFRHMTKDELKELNRLLVKARKAAD